MKTKEQLILIRKNFTMFVPIQKGAYQRQDEQTGRKYWYVNGYASSTNIDRDGDRMSDFCVKDMANQILGSPMTLFVDHEHGLVSGIGVITKAQPTDNGLLWIEARLEDPDINPLTKLILHKLDIGERIGLSIGGDLVDSHDEYGTAGSARVIDKVLLYEISAVGLPANADSFLLGSVFKSLKNIVKGNEAYSLVCKDGKCDLFFKGSYQPIESIKKGLVAVQTELVKRQLSEAKNLTEELDRFLTDQGVGPELQDERNGKLEEYRQVQDELDHRKMEEHVGSLLSEAYGQLTDGRFSQCVDDMSGKVDDPEAFCAWEHDQSLGRYPGSDKDEQTPTMNTLQYTHDQTDTTYRPSMEELQRVHSAIKHECPMGEESIPLNPMGAGTTKGKCKGCN